MSQFRDFSIFFLFSRGLTRKTKNTFQFFEGTRIYNFIYHYPSLLYYSIKHVTNKFDTTIQKKKNGAKESILEILTYV